MVAATLDVLLAEDLVYSLPQRLRTVYHKEPPSRRITDQRCDIYALGVTMYEMFAGQRPFPGIDNIARLMQTLSAVAEPPAKINPNISPELERIIVKATAKDPAKRYSTVQEILDELKPIADAERSKWNVSPPTPDTTILLPNATDFVA